MINSRSSTSYSAAHKLHPLSLLAQLISRQVSGCLKLTARASEWRLLFNRGQLNFATSSVDAFDRLDRQLQLLNQGLPKTEKDQMRRLFEGSDEVDEVVSRDYRAICWLVEQQHLTNEQAGQLVGAIATEVIESFLSIREGSYALIPAPQTEGIPTFCNLDLRPIVELCQRNSKQRSAGDPLTSKLPLNANVNAQLFNAQSDSQSSGQINGKGPMVSAMRTSSSRQGIGNPKTTLKRRTYTVACIDDSPTVLNAIQKFLADQSLSVVAINDPVKALMQIVRSKPDLILLNITMPNLDGYELCSLLRRHSRYKRTPIVMVTGNTGLIDRARAKLVRASGYLTKPFTQSDLLKMVFKHLPTEGR
ncbi:MAG: two-component system response regulator [Phormidesmis priestleyi]|uniref:Two-component system response regulator n=1 Tax=Phormidesmis priestleyi TaxID=268141 RepID=A0A2W4WZT0_9CYAN|nr:MAG: two-component system response regulator [Phormidesmis priestleyi]